MVYRVLCCFDVLISLSHPTLSLSRVKGHLVHMLIDTSHPLARGDLLHKLFTTHQEKQETHLMHRVIIRSMFGTLSVVGVVCRE